MTTRPQPADWLLHKVSSLNATLSQRDDLQWTDTDFIQDRAGDSRSALLHRDVPLVKRFMDLTLRNATIRQGAVCSSMSEPIRKRIHHLGGITYTKERGFQRLSPELYWFSVIGDILVQMISHLTSRVQWCSTRFCPNSPSLYKQLIRQHWWHSTNKITSSAHNKAELTQR